MTDVSGRSQRGAREGHADGSESAGSPECRRGETVRDPSVTGGLRPRKCDCSHCEAGASEVVVAASDEVTRLLGEIQALVVTRNIKHRALLKLEATLDDMKGSRAVILPQMGGGWAARLSEFDVWPVTTHATFADAMLWRDGKLVANAIKLVKDGTLDHAPESLEDEHHHDCGGLRFGHDEPDDDDCPNCGDALGSDPHCLEHGEGG